MSKKQSRRVLPRALAVLVLSSLTAQTAYAQQPVAATAAPSTPWHTASTNSVPANPQMNPLPAVQLTSASSTASELDPLPAASDQVSVQDIMRRLEQTEAELAEFRAQSQAAASGGPNAKFASLQQGGSGTAQKGVEDRIKELEAATKAASTKMPLVRLSGFFQLDTAQVSQDAASMRQYGDVPNGTGFRRTRLQALGKLTEFTNFSIEMDFAFAGRPSFMDVWGEQQNLPLGTVRVGQYRQPVTMDSWTNIKHLEFLERSAPFIALDPFRRVGIMDYWVSESQNTMIAASVYNANWSFWNGTQTQTSVEGLDNRYGTSLGDNGNVGASFRGSHLLYYDDYTEGRRLLHVGGGYTYQAIAGGGGTGSTLGGSTFRATTVPEYFVGDQGGNFSTWAGTPNVLDTGRISAHNSQLLHAEFAGNYGAAHFQTEYMQSFVDQFGGPMIFYEGAYAQAGYFLTGESCGYNKQLGVMDYNVKPFTDFFGLGSGRGICGWGAWEVAARWSYLNLQSNRVNAANYVGVAGAPGTAAFNPSSLANAGQGPNAGHPNPGILNEPTLALNWWWNQYTRVQFNYIISMVDSQYMGYSRMEAYTARFQIEF